ncbi:MAG: hypothetical protein ACREJP_02945, partial [Candidatus Methylomirabilales bacterium]
RGVKEEGGIVEQILRELKVKCLPRAIPDGIQLDISTLNIGDVVHVKDLAIPGGVELLTDREQVVVTVAAASVEEVAVPAAVEVAPPEAAEAPPKEGAAKEAAKPGTAKESARPGAAKEAAKPGAAAEAPRKPSAKARPEKE